MLGLVVFDIGRLERDLLTVDAELTHRLAFVADGLHLHLLGTDIDLAAGSEGGLRELLRLGLLHIDGIHIDGLRQDVDGTLEWELTRLERFVLVGRILEAGGRDVDVARLDGDAALILGLGELVFLVERAHLDVVTLDVDAGTVVDADVAVAIGRMNFDVLRSQADVGLGAVGLEGFGLGLLAFLLVQTEELTVDLSELRQLLGILAHNLEEGRNLVTERHHQLVESQHIGLGEVGIVAVECFLLSQEGVKAGDAVVHIALKGRQRGLEGILGIVLLRLASFNLRILQDLRLGGTNLDIGLGIDEDAIGAIGNGQEEALLVVIMLRTLAVEDDAARLGDNL